MTPRGRIARILGAATRDEVRLVRLRAAGSLAEYPCENLEPGERQAVQRALAELEGSYEVFHEVYANLRAAPLRC